MGSAQRIATLAFALFVSSSLFGQDLRLLEIGSIYIVPNGDDKETRQLEEKIPAETGWKITNDKSKADALLLYSIGSSGASLVYHPPGSATGAAIPIVLKTVEVFTNTNPPDLVWKYQRRGTKKIAGDAVKRIRRDLDKLRKNQGRE